MAANKRRVLVVDDEATVRESLRLLLSRLYEVEVAADGEEALTKIAPSGSDSPVDLVLVDVMMPGIDGIALLEQLRSSRPQVPVIMLTASNSVRSAVEAMKLGAVDYLNKPFDVDELVSLVEEALTNGPSGRIAPTQLTTNDLPRLNLPEISGDFGRIVGKHPVMLELYLKLEQLAERETTILISGESGTGKELVAREIHLRSARREGPFVALNCAAIPETLIESELFGHEKGAFTHAVEKRLGLFELAHGGTLLLDEIGELSLPIQVKMLRFLQEHEFYRVGRSKPIQVDVRILAATNKNLERAVKSGAFRQDLYYRINVVALELPPLRDRPDDIPALLDHFMATISSLYSGRKLSFSADALELLKRYPWPGNVRELENVAESLLALAPKDSIGAADLPTRFRVAESTAGMKDRVLAGEIPFEEAERAFETELIVKALERTNYIQTRAAELLGISRRILKYKMDKLGIPDEPLPPPK